MRAGSGARPYMERVAIGRPYNPGLTLCAAPGLFQELHDLLGPLNPERDA